LISSRTAVESKSNRSCNQCTSTRVSREIGSAVWCDCSLGSLSCQITRHRGSAARESSSNALPRHPLTCTSAAATRASRVGPRQAICSHECAHSLPSTTEARLNLFRFAARNSATP